MTHVDWHPYPKEKPKFYEPVLVTLLYHDGSEFVEIDILHCYQHLKIKEKWGFDRPDRKVIAWAELPEPYNPEEPEDNHPDAITARKYAEGDPDTVKALHIFDE